MRGGHPGALPDTDLLTCLISRGRGVSHLGGAESPMGGAVCLPRAGPRLPGAGVSPVGGVTSPGGGAVSPVGGADWSAVRPLLPHLRPCVLSPSRVGGEDAAPPTAPHLGVTPGARTPCVSEGW